jgi:hypothetical protein
MAAAIHSKRATLVLLGLSGILSSCAVAMHEQMNEKKAAIQSIADQCHEKMQADRSLDPLRNKLELWRGQTAPPPPFEILSNDAFPTDTDRPLIARWARRSILANRRRCTSTALSGFSSRTTAAR